MSATQKVVVRKTANNTNAKYKLKYNYTVTQTNSNNTLTTKYSYSKLIKLIAAKYSYSL